MEQKIAAPRNIIKRIKWKSVLTFLVVVIAVILILIGFNPFLSYKGAGDVKIKSWADPNRINLQGTSTIWIDVKNQGNENKNVLVVLKSYDPTIKFSDTNSQEENKTVFIGKGGSKKIDFGIQVSADYSGDYGIKITATYDKGTVDDEVYISVTK